MPPAAPSQKRPADADSAEISPLEDLVGYNLKRAYVIFQADFRRALGEDGFAPRVFSVLSLVVGAPNITQSEVARRLGIERSGLVAIVDELEGRGLIRRTTVPGDRRVQALVATEDGAIAHADALAAVEAHEAALLTEFSAAERRTLLDLLQKIRAMGDATC